MTDEPKLLAEPREGVPNVIDTLPAFRDYCSELASSHGSLAADAERASGFRYGHEDWLVQFKRDGAGIGLLDPQALAAAGADWNDFNRAVGDAVWILHDSLQDLPGFAELGMEPQRLFDTEIAARLLGLKRFGLAAVTEHFLGLTLAKEHSAADWSYRPLPRDWRNYAALDVELLIELETKMRAELKRQGKMEWAQEEFDYALKEGLGPRKEHPIPWMHVSHITEVMRDRQALAIVRAMDPPRRTRARIRHRADPATVRQLHHRSGETQTTQRCAIPFDSLHQRTRAHPYRFRTGQDVRTVRADSTQNQTEHVEEHHPGRARPAAKRMAGRGRRRRAAS